MLTDSLPCGPEVSPAIACRDQRSAGRVRALSALAVLTAILWILSASSACARGISEQLGEQLGREALRRQAPVWYDAEHDAVRHVAAPAPSKFPGRHSQWRRTTPEYQPNSNYSSPGGSATLAKTLEILIWVLAILSLISLLAVLIWAFANRLGLRSGRAASTFDAEQERAALELDRVEQLPVVVQATKGDFLDQAREYYRQGNLRDAIIFLFSHQLIQLDNRQLIDLERGKTNRQYLRELRGQPQLRDLVEVTMIAFEDVFFGHHQLTRERFEHCLSGLDTFRQLLAGDSK